MIEWSTNIILYAKNDPKGGMKVTDGGQCSEKSGFPTKGYLALPRKRFGAAPSAFSQILGSAGQVDIDIR